MPAEHLFVVAGRSMEPTIRGGSIIQVDESWLADLLTPGDVVVLQRNTEYHVKRIIAVAGQTVDYEVGWLMVNGKKTIWVGGNFPFKGQLKPDEFYVIGDNIFVSLDSRFLGPIKPDDICGKVHLCQKIGP